jgi:flagellar biosynthesis protein FliQ
MVDEQAENASERDANRSTETANGPTLACPQCGTGRLRFNAEWAVCDNCGHRVPAAFAAELLTYETRHHTLLARRDWLAAQVAAGEASRYLELGLAESASQKSWRLVADQWAQQATTQQAGAPPSARPPALAGSVPTSLTQMQVGKPARAPRKPVLSASAWTVASALYLLGGALVVFAIVGVAALTWRHLGAFGQGALLLVAALALAAVAHGARHRVPGLALTFSVLATSTVPIAILEATYQRNDFGNSWWPTVAAASGALFALGGWRLSRLASYAWALFALLELALVLTIVPLGVSGHAVRFGAFLVVLLGSSAITAFSLVTRASRTLRSPAFVFGAIGLMASAFVALAVESFTSRVSAQALALLLVAMSVLFLSPVWRQRRAPAIPYLAWGGLYLAVALLGFGANNFRTISWWTPVPLAVVSVAALARSGSMWRWPRYALFTMSSIALTLAIIFGIPGMLHEGAGHAWWWKAYVAVCAIAVLALRGTWTRFGADALRAGELSGWILLTAAVASVGLVWVRPGVVPGPSAALPLLAWSVVLLIAQGRIQGQTREIVFGIGITGLGLASLASLFALSPIHRTAWSIYALAVAVILVIAARLVPLPRAARFVFSVAASAVLALPLALACVDLASPNGQANYFAAVLVAAVGALSAFAPRSVQTRLSVFNTDAFAVAVWVFGGVGIATNVVYAPPTTAAAIVGTYLLLVAVSLAAATVVRRWYGLGWVAAVTASAGWLFLFSTWTKQPIEFASVPIALMLLAAGLATWYLRQTDGHATSSYVIFTPALAVALMPSVVATWITSDLGHPGTRWFTLVVAATTLTIAGAVWRLAGIFVPAVAALVLALAPQLVAGGSQLLTVLPSWLFYAVIGIALIACAARLEWLRGAGRQSRRWFASLT